MQLLLRETFFKINLDETPVFKFVLFEHVQDLCLAELNT